MSRWRCGDCKHIVNNRTWNHYPECPSCGESNPDEEWVLLDHEICENLWLKQENKRLKEAIKLITEEVTTCKCQQQLIDNVKSGEITTPRKLSVRASFSVFLADFKVTSSK